MENLAGEAPVSHHDAPAVSEDIRQAQARYDGSLAVQKWLEAKRGSPSVVRPLRRVLGAAAAVNRFMTEWHHDALLELVEPPEY